MLFLTSVIDRPVEGKSGEMIGRISDLIVRIGDDRYPPITGLVVRDGRRRFFVAASHPPVAQRHRPAHLLHRRPAAVRPP